MPKNVTPKRYRPFNAKELAAINGVLAGKSLVDAYADAGYWVGQARRTAYNQASMFFKRPKIAAEIARRQAKAARKADITLDRVLAELAAVGFSRATDFMRITEGGEPAVDLSNLDDRQKAALAEVTVEDFTNGRGEDARDVRRVKFKLHDKLSALDKIARLKQWYVDRHELSGADGGPVLVQIVKPVG